jgi:hypothetical protein
MRTCRIDGNQRYSWIKNQRSWFVSRTRPCSLPPQDNQLMAKHRVRSFKPCPRLEWRGQDGQNETEQPDHSASLGDSIAPSRQIGFSVHTGLRLLTDGLRLMGSDGQAPRDKVVQSAGVILWSSPLTASLATEPGLAPPTNPSLHDIAFASEA